MIFLSICIPTYNRCNYLRKTIESIVHQSVFFQGEIEIIVSDNASDDGTKGMMEQYASSLMNVHYYRNDRNLGVNVNIYNCFRLANGSYRKLSNDTFVFLDGSLAIMLNEIIKVGRTRPFLFFTNSIIKQKEYIRLKNIDEVVQTISYNLSWDVVLGFWDNELVKISSEHINEWFWALPVFFEIINEKKDVLIVNTKIFDNQEVKRKNLQYGLVEVFANEYLGRLRLYLNNGLSRKNYSVEKKRLLYCFFLPWFKKIKVSNEYQFSKSDTLSSLRDAYGSILPYFTFRLYMYVFLFHMKRMLKGVWAFSNKK